PIKQKKIIVAKNIKYIKDDAPNIPDVVKGRGKTAKIAPLPEVARTSVTKKVVLRNPLIQSRPKNFGIGQCVQPKRDLYRFVKWPKLAHQVFRLAEDYRPISKQARKAQLKIRASKRIEKKPDIEQPKPKRLIHGIREVTSAIQQKKARLVLIAHDVEPVEIVLFLPALCRKMNIPYAIVKGKARLGILVRRKTCTKDISKLGKIIETVKSNYNDRFEEVIYSNLVMPCSKDSTTLGRWYHGQQINCSSQQIRKGKSKGAENKTGLIFNKSFNGSIHLYTFFRWAFGNKWLRSTFPISNLVHMPSKSPHSH
ncbi:unnamed protein product, partial [Protopolystoma xenopodis]